MTRDEILAMAQEAGFKVNWQHSDVAELKAQRHERFAELVRNQALEDAATEAERMTMYPGGKQEGPAHDNVWEAARAIRKMKERAK